MECMWVSDQTGTCRVTLISLCVEVKANRKTLSTVLGSDMHSRMRAKVLPLQNFDFIGAARRGEFLILEKSRIKENPLL